MKNVASSRLECQALEQPHLTATRTGKKLRYAASVYGHRTDGDFLYVDMYVAGQISNSVNSSYEISTASEVSGDHPLLYVVVPETKAISAHIALVRPRRPT